jgi:hypothetical protein
MTTDRPQSSLTPFLLQFGEPLDRLHQRAVPDAPPIAMPGTSPGDDHMGMGMTRLTKVQRETTDDD